MPKAQKCMIATNPHHSQASALQLLLGCGYDQISALLQVAGGSPGLVKMSNAQIRHFGLDYLQIVKLREILRFAREHAQTPVKHGEKLTGSEQVFRMFHERLRHEQDEYCFMLILCAQNCLISEVLVAKGNENFVSLTTGTIFGTTLREGGRGIVLVHNHPSGDHRASKQDVEIAKSLKHYGSLLGVALKDFVIIGNGGYTSIVDDLGNIVS